MEYIILAFIAILLVILTFWWHKCNQCEKREREALRRLTEACRKTRENLDKYKH